MIFSCSFFWQHWLHCRLCFTVSVADYQPNFNEGLGQQFLVGQGNYSLSLFKSLSYTNDFYNGNDDTERR